MQHNSEYEIETIFINGGATFCSSTAEIATKLKTIKAFVFDWDGVFNNASKSESHSSTFNEADSMGTNLLRFSYFFSNKSLPATAIISGEKNQMAFHFCRREHFTACYFSVKHKRKALEHFCESNNLKPQEICFMFDDVLDLSIAEVCGLRVLVRRKANPLFEKYVVKNNLVDYITGAESGNFAVREASEMLIGLSGNYDNVIAERTKFSDVYTEYFNKRQNAPTAFFTLSEMEITEQIINPQ